MRHLLLAAAAALTLGSPPSAVADSPISVVAAENFYGDLAAQIGGRHVAVTSILSNPDDDPHLFESNASTARAIAAAHVVVYNGADYDPWMAKLLSASTQPDRKVFVAAALTGHRSGDNPHLWYDPATLPALATALAAEYARRDPADAAEFERNRAAFDTSFAPLRASVATVRAQYAGTKVTATEPVFGYMAAALGFAMLNGDFQVAVMNNAEPSASQVAAFEKSLTDREAKILFYNSQVTDQTTARLLAMAKAANIPVVGVTETQPKGQTIQTWFAGELDATKAALGGTR